MTETGAAIKAMREAAKMSLRETARRASVSPGYLSRVERGEREASEDWLKSIARAIGEYLSERHAA